MHPPAAGCAIVDVMTNFKCDCYGHDNIASWINKAIFVRQRLGRLCNPIAFRSAAEYIKSSGSISGGMNGVIVTTTPSVEGNHIREYLGVVAGEAVMGANIVKDLFATVTDIVGGRSATYENELIKARHIALKEMQDEAAKLGGNAVVGVDIDYEVIRQGMLLVTASGTAVKI